MGKKYDKDKLQEQAKKENPEMKSLKAPEFSPEASDNQLSSENEKGNKKGLFSGFRNLFYGKGDGAETVGNTPAPGPMGSFEVGQTNNDGANSSSGYSSDIEVKFSPDAERVTSSEIAFVQNVRVVDSGNEQSVDPRDNFKNRKTDDQWTIDRLDNRKHGWYGYDNDGTASQTISPGSSPTPHKDATLKDKPKWSKPNTRWDFETAAIDKAGDQGSKVYGSVAWGFTVDGDNKLTSHPVEETLTPSTEFDEAVEAWNEQAAGPEDERNHSDQQALGPFS